MFLFVTANEHERNAFEAKFKRDEERYIKGKTYYLGTFGYYSAAYIHIYKQGNNNPEATRLVGELINELKPNAVVMVGIAFGANEGSQKIGDVLVSEMILPYVDVKLRESKREYKETARVVGFQLLNAFREDSEWIHTVPDYKSGQENKSVRADVHVGAILTGPCLIDNYNIRQKLLKDFIRYEPIGGEMEAFGIYSETQISGVSEWIIIKGICDWGYNKSSEKKHEYQKVASEAAVDYCFHVFSRKGVFDSLVEKQNVTGTGMETAIVQKVKEMPKFVFTIDINGNAINFDEHTANALKEWYEQKATDIISEMRDESLRGTFNVVLNDLRVQNVDKILGEIYDKQQKGISLTEYEYNLVLCGVKTLTRDNVFTASAIELFLSNRVVRAGLGIYHLKEIQDMIMELLNFSYGDLTYKIPNNRELIPLAVFLNFNKENAKHEQFQKNTL